MGTTHQSIVINAPLAKVWSALRNFHDMSWAPNVITKLEVIGDARSDQLGTQRLLNDVFHETLRELSDVEHSMRYTIDDGPEPIRKSDVSNYVGHLSARDITEGDGGTYVEWNSSWQGNDAAAGEFCHGIYVALLGDMKKSLEG